RTARRRGLAVTAVGRSTLENLYEPLRGRDHAVPPRRAVPKPAPFRLFLEAHVTPPVDITFELATCRLHRESIDARIEAAELLRVVDSALTALPLPFAVQTWVG